MDCDLRQWKLQQQHRHQSEEHHQQQQHCGKIPRLVLEQPHQEESFASALPLFVPEQNLSAFSDSTTTRFTGMGSLFSSAQWQELELQALIYKYMLAGAPIPAELLQPILKKSFLHTPSPSPSPATSCYLYPYHQYQHYQPAMLQSGYWGRNAVDPEPGRCRRTDGKKWRCSKEIVLGHKYCERHVHRGRNRSRKLVETATPTVTEGGLKTPNPLPVLPIKALAMGNSHSTNFIQFNNRDLENKAGNGGIMEMQNVNLCGEGGSDGQLLRQFFDDWPRANENSNGVGRNGGPPRSGLSISTAGDVSDFSLKLSTGNGEDGTERAHLDWGTAWTAHQVSSMGGPLAEALRSATSNDSPTSVLYELNRGAASETSSVST